VKLDASFFDNERVVELTPFAQLLYLRILCLAKQIETDGRLSFAQIRRGNGDIDNLSEHVAELVIRGLWITEADGQYEIANWLERNRSKEEIEEIRAKRTDAGRRGGQISGEVRRAKRDADQGDERSKRSKIEPNTNPERESERETQRESSSESSLPTTLDDSEIADAELVEDDEDASLREKSLLVHYVNALADKAGDTITARGTWVARVLDDPKRIREVHELVAECGEILRMMATGDKIGAHSAKVKWSNDRYITVPPWADGDDEYRRNWRATHPDWISKDDPRREHVSRNAGLIHHDDGSLWIFCCRDADCDTCHGSGERLFSPAPGLGPVDLAEASAS
jgi:hypothetical protein